MQNEHFNNFFYIYTLATESDVCEAIFANTTLFCKYQTFKPCAFLLKCFARFLTIISVKRLKTNFADVRYCTETFL